jgi:hypothetical protein
MDQDQLSALIVAFLLAACIVGLCIRHIRDRNADAEQYDLHEEPEI